MAGMAQTSVSEATQAQFEASRKWAETPFGRVAYWERGLGPPAIFVHGFPLNGYHWRGAFARLGDLRRCIAPDLMGLGHTQPKVGQGFGFADQAGMILAFMDAIGVTSADFVGNDSGCAILQLLAVRAPDRVKSLTLTNGDAHDNYPPEAFKANHELAAAGQLAERMKALLTDIDLARSERSFGRTLQHPERLTPALLRTYIGPPLSTPERAANLNRYAAAIKNADTVAIYPNLKALRTPVMVVWGDSDPFFDVRWARWLGDTLPNSQVHVLKGARLFFPEERSEELAALIRKFWV